MYVAPILAFLLLVALVTDGWSRRRQRPPRGAHPVDQLRATGARLYTRRNLLKLVGATAGGAILTYSGLDTAFDEWHRDHVRSSATDQVARVAKGFGQTRMAAAPLLYVLADWALPGTALGRWGRECFTAMATGLPVLWGWQRVLGASRPSDAKEWGPRYRPFTDENSVSGHTFVGAIPFLVAARQVDLPVAAWSLRVLSPATGWSRLNDERHYLSQVVLGYSLAAQTTAAAETKPAGQPDTPPNT